MSTTQDEITALEEKLKQADINSNPDVIGELISDGAILTGQDGKMFSKQDVVTAHYPSGNQRFTRYEVSDFRVHDFGTTAIVTLRLDLEGKDFTAALRFTRIWMKTDNQWQIVAGHISAITK